MRGKIIGGRGHGGVARQEGHAFRQGVPPESSPPAAPGAATDFERTPVPVVRAACLATNSAWLLRPVRMDAPRIIRRGEWSWQPFRPAAASRPAAGRTWLRP